MATNVETTKQAQPADFTCLAYHELKAVLTGRPKPHCAMVIPQRHLGCSGITFRDLDELIGP